MAAASCIRCGAPAKKWRKFEARWPAGPRWACPPSIAKVLTVMLTRAFRQRMPQASLSIGEGLSVALASDLINGRLDIALLYNAAPSPDLELAPLLEEEWFLVQR